MRLVAQETNTTSANDSRKESNVASNHAMLPGFNKRENQIEKKTKRQENTKTREANEDGSEIQLRQGPQARNQNSIRSQKQ